MFMIYKADDQYIFLCKSNETSILSKLSDKSFSNLISLKFQFMHFDKLGLQTNIFAMRKIEKLQYKLFK